MNSSVHSIMLVAFNKSIAEELNIRLRNPRSLTPRTDYQKAICREVSKRQRHVLVDAKAGSGKTTTLEHIVSDYPGADARASTLHGFGFNSLRYHLKTAKKIDNINFDEHKIDVIMRQILGYEQLNADQQTKANAIMVPAGRLCDLTRTHKHTSILPPPTDEDMNKIGYRYDVDMPDPESGATAEDVYDLVRKTLEVSNKNLTTIDFVDMIHLPLLLNVRFWQNDLILVDESQDLDPSQIAMIKRAANGRAQVVFVGDRNQAIYGFRGADVEAIESVISEFNTIELPLSTSWRCPIAVIKEAQQIVPDIEWAPNALEGSVKSLPTHEAMFAMAEAGDFVLCRTTTPLVNACMKFIRAGKASTVQGRDIAKGLVTLATKIQKSRIAKGKDLISALQSYKENALGKLMHPSKEAQRQSMEDRLGTLLTLSEECSNFDELKNKIKSIFSDVKSGENKDLILCSTAHRAKGLESERVFIIHPELMPHPMARQTWQKKQEMNLKYVAITRAIRELYWVHDGKTEKAPESPPVKPEEKVECSPHGCGDGPKPRKTRSDKGMPRKRKETESIALPV
jgi:DNA helicase II / ATP-dependent DNA helicase PcrA